MTWEELSDAHREAAVWLISREHPSHPRAVCGRAYYAIYALITSKLPQGTQFARGWNNPPHEKLPSYVDRISGLNAEQRKRIKTAIRRLRQRREDSDYRPGVTVLTPDAVKSIRDAEEVRRLLM